MRVGLLPTTVGRLLVTVGAGLLLLAPAASAEPLPPPPDRPERIVESLSEAVEVAPGVTHRDITTTTAAGNVMGDVVEVDLTTPGVHADLLTPGAVAARAGVKAMADGSGAVAGINGDFFDIGRTSAPAGPAVQNGRFLKAAVPQGRRAAPAVPGAEMDYVFAVGTDGVARVDRLPLRGEVRRTGIEQVSYEGPRTERDTEQDALPIVALNQFAVPVGGIGVFTSDWGDADRARTLCGSDTDRDAPCAADQAEVVVRDGAVTAVRAPGAGRLPAEETALVGREQGAAALRGLKVGDRVSVDYGLVPASGVAPRMAVGGSPILRDGAPTERLDDGARAPRSGAGATADGHRMLLVTVDGRQSDSVGATLLQFSNLLRELGLDDAVNLDGGGSSTLAYRDGGAPATTIVNDPSDPSPRLVPNGIGVYSG
ncbi:phosphodiester glycosidase family protein [Pseudonocardia kujensis]|uniref:phosphodiester glycosidase family protein n=1 Tax=Pseudonocardia kujensis TaxID=1128675 RepID=UPI001E62F2EB|nr:phosphodiester glycosidase family protein [Pseudonocardia kujensis]MCE0765696.1 phosphodiester glycosidase family protein [Pseudonocardia kujensis]